MAETVRGRRVILYGRPGCCTIFMCFDVWQECDCVIKWANNVLAWRQPALIVLFLLCCLHWKQSKSSCALYFNFGSSYFLLTDTFHSIWFWLKIANYHGHAQKLLWDTHNSYGIFYNDIIYDFYLCLRRFPFIYLICVSLRLADWRRIVNLQYTSERAFFHMPNYG